MVHRRADPLVDVREAELSRDGVIVDAPRSSAASSLRVAIAVLHARPVVWADHVAAREREPIATVGVRITN